MGTRSFCATSCARMIFSGVRGHQEPEATVLSLATTTTHLPATLAQTVTTPAEGELFFSSPKVSPSFTKVSSGRMSALLSASRSTRSQAVSLPLARTRCW